MIQYNQIQLFSEPVMTPVDVSIILSLNEIWHPTFIIKILYLTNENLLNVDGLPQT